MINPVVLWRIACAFQFGILLIIYTYLGLTPAPENTVPIIYNDLFMHFGGYVVAAFSTRLLLPHSRTFHLALGLIAYSIAIEIAQHFNPPRTFSWLDIVANSAGVFTGLMMIAQLMRSWPWFARLITGNWLHRAAD